MPSQDSPQYNPDPAGKALAEAIVEHKAGRSVKAEHLYRAVIERAPRHIGAIYRLAVLYIQDGRPQEALPLLQELMHLQPQDPEILKSVGVALCNIGYHQEAVMSFRQALEIDPAHTGALNNLGNALFEQGQVEAALECFMKTIQTTPTLPASYIDIGKCHYEMGRLQEAVICFEKALALEPDYVDGLTALGAALWAVGKRTDACRQFYLALQKEPDNAKAILNFGEFTYDEGRIDEALELFNRALTLVPQNRNALWRKSFALLAKGEYREGWKLYAECLDGLDTRGPNLFRPMEPWNGRSEPNKHLLIWCEQGLGDILQFIRYAELCKSRVARVSIFCPKSLVRLFKALPFVDNVSSMCDRDSFDEHVPLMNLPHLFDTTLETVPAHVPYLQVEAEIQAKWAPRFEGTADSIKVGLVWAGGPHKGGGRKKIMDGQRSISLEMMKPWLDVQCATFYSLQKDKPASDEIAKLGLADRVIDFMGEVADFADTAAIVQNLDLVITVDTSVAHLAGGLGKPVWIMSRYNADWRWLQNRPTNPWYPTARIFGQPVIGDWHSVISGIGHELEREIRRSTHPR